MGLSPSLPRGGRRVAYAVARALATRRMRHADKLTALGGVLLVAWGVKLLLAPVPPPSDVPGFASVGAGILLLLAAACLRAGVAGDARAWRIPHYLLGAYAGIALAALFLAYKDNSAADWRALAGLAGLVDVALHLVVAPLEVALGALVGYADPEAPLYVLACLAVSLLGTRMLRRRLWPRLSGAGRAAPAGGPR